MNDSTSQLGPPHGHIQQLLVRVMSDLIGRTGPFPNKSLSMVITIGGQNIPTREFAVYLALIDRLYGRLKTHSLNSYARREEDWLRIAETHSSDLEIVFRLPPTSEVVATLTIIALFLRALPNMFKITTEGIRNLAESYKVLQEGKTIRKRGELALLNDREPQSHALAERPGNKEQRAILRETIQSDPRLERLNDSERSLVLQLLEDLSYAESSNLPRTIRFSKAFVKDVRLKED